MPNGRGTPSCIECKHVSIDWACGPSDAMCNFWKVRLPLEEEYDDDLEYLLPPEEYKYDNLVCRDYERKNEEVCLLSSKVISRMEKGLLYAIGYNEVSIPSLYHRVVCRLYKSTENVPESQTSQWKFWLEESVEDFVGERLLVTNVFSNFECESFVRNLLFKFFSANFIREDPGAPFFSIGKKVGKRPFYIRLLRFWDYRGKRYGGIAKIEEKRLWCNNFWVIFSIHRAGHYNFTDQIGQFIVHIGPEEPVFWNGIWPRFEKGSPRFSGLVEIRA